MKRKSKAGNKSLLTPKFIRQTERLAALGMTQRQIATILGVNACTISIWKAKDGKLEEKFQKALERGEARGVERRLRRIERAGNNGSWQADAWTLERRQPEQFGRRDSVRVSDPDGKPMSGTTVIAPTVVFIQPKKEELMDAAIDIPKLANGNGGPH